ncbi:MAG: hypothetical protein GF392_06165, partial [Candidatus Omnitrophica bacterium]|nr:hypothetical protein [Candidatus Omnitrophota bacterium]
MISVDRYNRIIFREYISGRDVVRGKKSAGYRAVTETGIKARGLRNITVEGRWSLTPEHDLRFKVSGSAPDGMPRTLLFRGDIKEAGGSFLTFRVRESETGSGTISLKGGWRADSNNRLVFDVTGKKGIKGYLRFQGGWKVGPRNEIIYTYTKRRHGKEVKSGNKLVIKGYWKLGSKRLSYHVSGSGSSVFSFRASLVSEKLKASDGLIRYTVGVRYRTRRAWSERRQVVSIYGRWKARGGVTVGFEAFAGDTGKVSVFRVEKMVRSGGRVTVLIRLYRERALSLKLICDKKISDNAELFFAFEKMADQYSVM